MDWRKREDDRNLQAGKEAEMRRQGDGEDYVKVMTDEQMEMLRKQIAVYSAICEQLLELHKAISSQEALSGIREGSNPYFYPLVASSAHKIATRHRWTPTATQLQVLEHIYDEGNGTPNKQKIKEIAAELSQHGQITETNVYNWFQNRRARSKRKQPLQVEKKNAAAAEVEMEGEAEEEALSDKKWKTGSMESFEHIFFPSPDLGIEHLLGKIEGPGDVSTTYGQPER